MVYRGVNGFTLRSDKAPGGWTIQSPQDIETALYSFPYFQTVAWEFLWEAIAQAVAERKEYKDIKEFAEYLAENYI